jgi:hypothetical protein
MQMKSIFIGGCALLLGGLGAGMAQAESWVDKVKLYGDVRFRLDSAWDESQTGAGKTWFRDRDRIRARLGAKATPNEYWQADISMATTEAGLANSGNPDSNNQTLGDFESKKPIWLDLANIQYRVLLNNGRLTAGKMNLPFDKIGGSSLIWDPDLTPEGWAGNFSLEFMPDTKIALNAAGFWVRENSATIDPQMVGAQMVVNTKVENIKVSGGFGYYAYVNTAGQPVFDYKGATTSANNYGNDYVKVTDSNGNYAFVYTDNYLLGEAFLSLAADVFNVPVTVFADWVLNHGAIHFNRAYETGLVLSKAKQEGEWELGYNFRMLEKDSVVGAFTDDDFGPAGTDSLGHNVYATYMITDAVAVKLTFFRVQQKIDTAVNPFYNRFFADVAFAF